MNDIKEILNETSGLYNDEQTTLENVLVLNETVSKIVNETLPDLDNKVDNKINEINNHINDKDNPHSVTKSQVGLGNVDNTSDINKPISTATQNALDEKLNTSNVVQETGTSETDVMSQKAVTDELNNTIKKDSPSRQEIKSNGTSTIIDFKTTANGGAYTSYADLTGRLGYYGFDSNKTPIIYEGESTKREILTNKIPYVVEKGTSNNWSYRLWSDNTLECWCFTTIASGTFSQWGSIWQSENYTSKAYPFAFASKPMEFANLLTTVQSGWLIKAESNTTTQMGQYRLGRPTNGYVGANDVAVYVIGTKA